MQLFYLATFLTGLLLGVYVMIRGVERVGTRGRSLELDALGRPVGTSRMALTAPTVGAFATLLGVTGYLLWRYTALPVGLQLALGFGAAVLGSVLATFAVAHWAKQAATHDAVDERYLLQGHPAQVTASITSAEHGEIAYLVGGKRYATRALSLDGTAVAAGTEVVIDRVEDGIAYVEPWVQVEQRL
jgi:membrane protein implicated in regulation of membrane protease activity